MWEHGTGFRGRNRGHRGSFRRSSSFRYGAAARRPLACGRFFRTGVDNGDNLLRVFTLMAIQR